METERFVFDTPKTCFNSQTGKKIADNVAALILFQNNWGYALLDDQKDVLLDENGQKVAENVNLDQVGMSCYVVGNDDDNKTVSLLTADGRVLFDHVQDVELFDCGWFIVQQNDVCALYRQDLSLVIKGFIQVTLLGDGEFIVAEHEPEVLTIYRGDGSILARNVKDFQFMTSTFYWLRFEDKTIIFDDIAKTQSVCVGELPELLLGNMYKAVSNGLLHLYRADGQMVLAAHKDYYCFDNGMILAQRDDDSWLLFNPHMEVVADEVMNFSGGFDDEFLAVSTREFDYLFDDKGNLVREDVFIKRCGHRCFLLKENGFEAGVLCRYDLTELETGVVDVDVFDNGWSVREKSPLPGQKETYYKLVDDENLFVASSPSYIDYQETYGTWIICNEKNKFSFHHVERGTLFEDADKIIAIGACLLVRRSLMVEIYSLPQLVEPQPLGTIPQPWMPIWSGDILSLKKSVSFCGGTCFGGEVDFHFLIDDAPLVEIGVRVVAAEKEDDDVDDGNDAVSPKRSADVGGDDDVQTIAGDAPKSPIEGDETQK